MKPGLARFSHSSQPNALGVTSRIVRECVQVFDMTVSFLG
jgi:hypothetical protein